MEDWPKEMWNRGGSRKPPVRRLKPFRRNYGARFEGGQIEAKKKSGRDGPESSKSKLDMLLQVERFLSDQAALGSASDGVASVGSDAPLPMVMPISKSVMVPPAKRANSES